MLRVRNDDGDEGFSFVVRQRVRAYRTARYQRVDGSVEGYCNTYAIFEHRRAFPRICAAVRFIVGARQRGTQELRTATSASSRTKSLLYGPS